jgi:mono/diheme cytochrome c family protein
MSRRLSAAFAMLAIAIFLAVANATSPIVVSQPAYTTTLPIYGATYSAAEPQQAATAVTLAEILAELKALRADMASLRSPQPGGGVVQELKANPLDVLKTRCASCHNPKTAATKGGELVLVDDYGNLKRFSKPDKRAIADRVNKGTMPPSGKLSEADKAAVLDAVNNWKFETK